MPRLMLVVVPAFLSALAGCGRDASAVPGKETTAAPATSAAMKTQPADTDPCSWITAAEATKLLGPLDGSPWRADHSDRPEPDPKGHACGYTLASSGGGTAGEDRIAVELRTEDAISAETGFAMAADKLRGDVGKGVAGDVAGALGNRQTAAGWDKTTQLPDMFVGRLGAIAIRIGIYSSRVPGDSIERLAALVRDRIPDLPFAVPRRLANSGDGPDPCSLVTREEAEAALGKLAFAPYRSNSRKSGFADPRGEGCSYYLGKHRVFTIDATWEQGKTIFPMVAGLSQHIASAVGANGQAADTLEGGWDQASAGPAGSLYFLKGDQMLDITYITAGVDLGAAVRLARLAVGRLK